MLEENNAAAATVDPNAAAAPNAEFLGTLGVEDERLNTFSNVGELTKAFLEKDTAHTELQGTMPIVPDSPDKYTLEGAEEAMVGKFQQLAHELGLSQEKAPELVKFFNTMGEQAEQAAFDKQVAGLESLRGEWKENFDANAAVAKQAVSKFGGDDLKMFLKESGLGNNPLLVKMFHKIGVAVSEDSLLTGPSNKNQSQRPTGVDGRPMLDFSGSMPQ